MYLTYLANTFSAEMLADFDSDLKVRKVRKEDLPENLESAVANEDIARILGIPARKVGLSLGPKDKVYVARLVGGYLKPGSITIPEGTRIEYFSIEVFEPNYLNFEQ